MKGKYKIIIAEDEAPIRRNLINKIDECGMPFKVEESFRNGEKAFLWLEENSADLLLTDIKMPNMDGLELAKKVSERYPQIPVVIISGFNNFEYAREAIKYRVTDYLTKPVDIDELKNLLQSVKKRLDESNPDINSKAEEIIKAQNCVEYIDDVCVYINNHFKEQITIADIANEFNSSQENLARLFKKSKGITLQKYIIQVRISEAKKIIRSYENLDIQSVGGIVGYQDPYYFSRIFKKYTSMSPSQYRKSYAK